MSKATIEPFAPAHLDGLIALVAAEGWIEYADDVQRTYRALTAPGVTTLVAIMDGQVAAPSRSSQMASSRRTSRCS
jgi:hypothetical protein